MNPVVAALAIVLAYFCGTLPSAILIAKSKGIDITTFGSGNPGASNISRALGAKYGALVFLLDAGKGAIPVVLTLGYRPIAFACAAAAIVGHMFPVTRHFKGGKGVATGGGVLLPLNPPVMIGTLIAWLLIMKVSKKASIASISIVPIMLIALAVRGTAGWELLALLGMGVLVEIRHISNIKRLISGSEPPVTGVSH